MRGEMVTRSLPKEVIRKRPKGRVFELFNPWEIHTLNNLNRA